MVTPDKLAKARQNMAVELNVREAAARVKVGKTSLYAALTAEKSRATPGMNLEFMMRSQMPDRFATFVS